MSPPDAQHTCVSDAVILMAGAGSRLGRVGDALAKPLVKVGGRPLLSYTLDAFERAGVETIHTVMGANHDLLGEQIAPLIPRTMRLNVIVNPEWKKQNGVSV
jgi:choline kinase